ncbi:MAG: hypothetical protein PHN45_01150, partial [Methylococcales bacterium]|nr:hypothetical protein [Methylococcales bacterium]
LATPTGLTMSLFPPYVIQWNKVQGATSYRIVITQDKYYNGFTESNNGKGQCNDSCATVEIPATPDGNSLFDGGKILTSSDGTILYTPSPSIYAKSGTYPKIGINYIRIKAYGDKFSKSDWRDLTIAHGTGSDLFSTIKPSTIDPSALESVIDAINLNNEQVYSKTDKCRDYPDWCYAPNYDLFGLFAQQSSESINLINNSYVIDGLKSDLGTIKANIYNRGYADAVIDIYDAKKNWYSFATVSGHRPATNVLEHMIDTATNNYESWTTELSSFDPRRPTSSKKTEVELFIPLGGYAVMTKNSTTALANTVLAVALDYIGGNIKYIPKGSARMQITKLISVEIAKSIVFKDLIEQLKITIGQDKILEPSEISKKITKEVIAIGVKVMITDGDKIFQILGKNKRIYAQIIGKKGVVASFLAQTGKRVAISNEISEAVATRLSIFGQLMNITRDNDNKNVIFKRLDQ